jgi:hypothetical protein
VLYVEPDDEKGELFPVIAGQKKPVVLMLAEQSRAFLRPEDFSALKHIKRQYSLAIIFVFAHSSQLKQLASKNGFPVYDSMDRLADAISAGHMVRQRALARPTLSLDEQLPRRNTRPLPPQDPVIEQVVMPPAPPEPELRQSDEPVIPREQMMRSTLARNQRADSDLLFRSFPGHDASEEPYGTIPTRPQFAQASGRKHISKLLVVLSVALVICIIGSFFIVSKLFQPVSSHTTNNAANTSIAAKAASVGQLVYTSSGQVNENTSQGISDQIVLNLHNVPAPAANEKYYAWLLGDKGESDPITIALGALTVTNGDVQLNFGGDAQHSNLLLTTSRVLITEEDDTMTPIAPSLDTSTWRYYGAFSSTPIVAADNPEHYSYLDHLRHLLAADPTLDELELPGGLNNWFYNNTSKLVEWTSSMRETWMDTKDTAFIQRQTTRVLSYLDGSTFLYKDIPGNAPLLVDARLARVGLLDVDGPNQEPPDYVEHIDKHLRGLLEANDTSVSLREQINAMITAINNINHWLTQLRQDSQKLLKMSTAQLKQPATLTLLNDMILNSNDAFAGQVDPSTGQALQGVSWLHEHMQLLATINLTKVQPDASGAIPEILPGQMSTQAFVPAKAE